MHEAMHSIGRYEIVSEFGRGALGWVYKGRDPVSKRCVVIKTLTRDDTDPQKMERVERFKREADAAARLNHPNIASVYEYGEDGDLAFVASECVDGNTLADQAEHNRALGFEDSCRVMLDVLNALDYAHGQGVVHGGIKPSNIMRTNAGETKIAGFGVAQIESSESARAGTVLGIPDYMSPEQLLGQPVDHRSDIFSCGVVFYELLTGERAFSGSDTESTIHNVINTELPPASKRCPGLPAVVDAILSRALTKRLTERFSRARDFAQAIDIVLMKHPGAALPAGKVAPGHAGNVVRLGSRAGEQWVDSVSTGAGSTVQHAGDMVTERRRTAGRAARRTPVRSSLLKPLVISMGFLAVGALVLTVIVLKPFDAVSKRLASFSAPGPTVPPATDAGTGVSPAEQARPAAARVYRPGSTLKDCEGCPELVVVPPGSFVQGSPDSEAGREQSEGPQHMVEIGYPLAVGKFEITRDQFGRFADETGYPAAECWIYDSDWVIRADRNWHSPGFEQDDSHPATCVSWTDAEAYVDWLSRRTGNDYRLLSSSEWEYVARAGAKTPNSWSDDPAASCQLANVADRSAQNAYPGWEAYSCSDSYIYTAPVASFQPNNFGVYGMLGNVFEWVEDCWNDSYNGAPGDGSAWMSGDCGERQLRGGSWFSRPRYVRFAFRNHFTRESRASTFGFRVARVLGGS